MKLKSCQSFLNNPTQFEIGLLVFIFVNGNFKNLQNQAHTTRQDCNLQSFGNPGNNKYFGCFEPQTCCYRFSLQYVCTTRRIVSQQVWHDKDPLLFL